MGNSLGGRREVVVDEQYTRPRGLHEHKDIDHNRLRKLILDAKLAPCYPGDGDCTTQDLEECPICFLYYPSLNRSRCCTKGICTECFLLIKPLHSTRRTQCPFCNASNYAVEYRGVRSEEEKAMEQIEEQRVIEAKIRMQQQELLDEKEHMQVRLDCSSSNQSVTTGGVGYTDIPSNSLAVPSYSLPDEGNEICSYHAPCPATSVSPSIPFRSNGSSSTVTRATSTPSSSVQRTTSTATVKPGLRKPVFIKVDHLKPGTNGHTLAVKVVTSVMILQKGHVASSHLRQSRIAECLVGDETGTVVFTARNEQVDMMKPGATVNLRNAKIDMFKGFMRLAIDKWGRIEVIEPPNFIVKEDNNLSLVEYELVSEV